jgi:hypothetical protein
VVSWVQLNLNPAIWEAIAGTWFRLRELTRSPFEAQGKQEVNAKENASACFGRDDSGSSGELKVNVERNADMDFKSCMRCVRLKKKIVKVQMQAVDGRREWWMRAAV